MNNEDLVRTAMTLDDRLDDIKRAQIWTRIDRAIDARPARAFRRHGVVALAVGACAAAALVGWVVLHRAPQAIALVAPGDSTLTAHVGPHTRAELIGPARLELDGSPGDATRVRLREGALVAEFTGGPGRSLHIDAPGAAIDIVGTLFAVDVTRDGTCVSVAHGKVSVTAGATKLAVSTGESWCSARPRIEPLAPAARDRFDRFAAIAVASADVAPTAPVPPVVDVQSGADTSKPANPARVEAPSIRPPGAEPARVEPTRVQAPRTEPAQVEPPRIEPPRVEPKRVEPSRVEPTRVEAPRTEPAQVEPPRTEPSRVQAPRTEPAQVEAPRTEPSRVEPSRIESAGTRTPGVEPSRVEAPRHDAPPPAPATVVRPAPAPVTAESLYQGAEAALAKRDLAAADRALATLVVDFADSPLVGEATYERARIAYQRHAWSDARRQLEKLAQDRSSPLAEPGAYLACRIDVETHDDAAARCLTDYRKTYPGSPHDLDVLGLLVDLAYRDGGCARATPAIDELARSHPRAPLVKAWRARCEAHP